MSTDGKSNVETRGSSLQKFAAAQNSENDLSSNAVGRDYIKPQATSESKGNNVTVIFAPQAAGPSSYAPNIPLLPSDTIEPNGVTSEVPAQDELVVFNANLQRQLKEVTEEKAQLEQEVKRLRHTAEHVKELEEKLQKLEIVVGPAANPHHGAIIESYKTIIHEGTLQHQEDVDKLNALAQAKVESYERQRKEVELLRNENERLVRSEKELKAEVEKLRGELERNEEMETFGPESAGDEETTLHSDLAIWTTESKSLLQQIAKLKADLEERTNTMRDVWHTPEDAILVATKPLKDESNKLQTAHDSIKIKIDAGQLRLEELQQERPIIRRPSGPLRSASTVSSESQVPDGSSRAGSESSRNTSFSAQSCDPPSLAAIPEDCKT